MNKTFVIPVRVKTRGSAYFRELVEEILDREFHATEIHVDNGYKEQKIWLTLEVVRKPGLKDLDNTKLVIK